MVKWLGPESQRQAKSIRAANIANLQTAIDLFWDRLDLRYDSPEIIKGSLQCQWAKLHRLTSNSHQKYFDLLDLATEILAIKKFDEEKTFFSYFDSSHGVNKPVCKRHSIPLCLIFRTLYAWRMTSYSLCMKRQWHRNKQLEVGLISLMDVVKKEMWYTQEKKNRVKRESHKEDDRISVSSSQIKAQVERLPSISSKTTWWTQEIPLLQWNIFQVLCSSKALCKELYDCSEVQFVQYVNTSYRLSQATGSDLSLYTNLSDCTWWHEQVVCEDTSS